MGGTGDDMLGSIQQTTDGGYVVSCNTDSNDGDVSGYHGGGDCWIIKLNNSGTIQWQKTLGGINGDSSASIQQTTDGGYIVAGNTNSNDGDVSGYHGGGDCWIVKLNNSGIIQWQKTLGGTNSDWSASIQQTTDGGYIVSCNTTSNDGDVSGYHGGRDCWIVKLNSSGTIQWQKTLGGTYNEQSYNIQQTTDGGYIVGSSTYSNDGDVSGYHGGGDCWIVKLNNSGTIQWQKTLGGTGIDVSDEGLNIQQTTDGGYVVRSNTYSNDGDVSGYHGDWDCWIVKLNNSGTIQWQKTLGGTNGDLSESIQQTTDGGYIVAGLTFSNDGDVSGHHGGGYGDYWIVKIKDDSLNISNFIVQNNISIYPNTANDHITIDCGNLANVSGWHVVITNTLGQEVFNQPMNTQQYVVPLNSWTGQGVYFVKIYNAQGILVNTKKIILQ